MAQRSIDTSLPSLTYKTFASFDDANLQVIKLSAEIEAYLNAGRP